MKKARVQNFIIFFISTMFLVNCNEDYINTTEVSNIKNSTKALLEISYKMTTTRDYEIAGATVPDLDLATLNPSSEKQVVKMDLFESGQLDITIEEVDFSKKINHRINRFKNYQDL